ncbi:Uncharacterised protein [BD1-7 clade bacterium]|nr:Uncharacterised protein [BD1-7 clade bacterium]
MPLSLTECLDRVASSDFIHQSECHAVAQSVFDLLSQGDIESGNSLRSLIESLKTTMNVPSVYKIDYSLHQLVGHSFVLIQHMTHIALLQSFGNGYTLSQWLERDATPNIADIKFSPTYKYSKHTISKFLNLLEYELSPPFSDAESFIETFKRMFGGNSRTGFVLRSGLASGFITDDSWGWSRAKL